MKSIGGAESNVTIGLTPAWTSRGARTRVGDDPFGEEIVRTLRAEGVDIEGSRARAGSPPRYLARASVGALGPTGSGMALFFLLTMIWEVLPPESADLGDC